MENISETIGKHISLSESDNETIRRQLYTEVGSHIRPGVCNYLVRTIWAAIGNNLKVNIKWKI